LTDNPFGAIHHGVAADIARCVSIEYRRSDWIDLIGKTGEGEGHSFR
jgi:hypothetical protein